MNKRIERALNFDPIDFVEKTTGEEIGGADDEVSSVAFLLHRKSAKRKEAILKSEGDTTFTMKPAEYKQKIEQFGFEEILRDEFTGDGQKEKSFVYWRDGLLLFWDTFWGKRNKASLYANAAVHEDREVFLPKKFGGGFYEFGDRQVWAGQFDAREALGYKVSRLEEWSDQILEYWKVHPSSVFLANWGEWRYSDDAAAAQKNRISRLPGWLRERIRYDDLDEDGRGNMHPIAAE